MSKRWLCLLVGHYRGVEYRDPFSQHPSMKGIKCYRCGKRLMRVNEQTGDLEKIKRAKREGGE